jgi:hypothetical protein
MSKTPADAEDVPAVRPETVAAAPTIRADPMASRRDNKDFVVEESDGSMSCIFLLSVAFHRILLDEGADKKIDD